MVKVKKKATAKAIRDKSYEKKMLKEQKKLAKEIELFESQISKNKWDKIHQDNVKEERDKLLIEKELLKKIVLEALNNYG